MISLVIYGIIAIGLASAAGYAFLVFTNSSKQVTYTQENALRMDNAVAGVRASLLALSPNATNGGVLFPPMGVSVSDNQGHTYTTIPNSLGAINTTPWGQPYAYCPLSQTNTPGLASGGGNTLTTSVSVTPPDSNPYTVTTYSGPATANIAYVVANSGGAGYTTALANAAANGFVAFILSSQGPGQTVPSCDQITFNATTHFVNVPNGVVRGVTAALPYTQRAVASIDRLEIFVGNGTTGDGTGRDASNVSTMDYAMGLWLSLQPRQTDIWITSSSVGIDTSMNVEDVRTLSGLGENSSLVFAPSGLATAQLTLGAAATSTAYELNSAVTFENLTVTVGGGTVTATKPLTFKNVTLAGTSTSTPVNVIGTTLLADNTSFKNIALTATNSDVELYNLSERGASAATTFTASTLNANASRISFDGQSAATFTFSGNAAANITAIASQINIAPLATVLSKASNDGVVLYASNLSVQGTLTMTGQAGTGALDAIAHSGVYVSAASTAGANPGVISAQRTSGYMPYGVYLNGSTMGLEGTLTVLNLGTAAIGLQQSQLTSLPKAQTQGTINLNGQSATVACVNLLQGVGAMAPDVVTPGNPGTSPGTSAPASFLLYKAYNAGLPDAVTFAQAQYGIPLLTGFQDATLAPQDSTALSYINTTKGNDPLVMQSTAYATPPGGTQQVGYVDPTTFERGVRNIVNAEFISGSSMNFAGTCN